MGQAAIKTCPEDFRVTEHLGFEPSGRGEHLFFWVEKIGISTHEVAAELAEALALPRRAVSYSGRKDKHAVCQQWFSAHRPGIDRPRLEARPTWRVLSTTRNQRHLKIGSHRSNRFDVRLRQVDGDPEQLQRRFEQIRLNGVPNYFGRQRFGWDNLERALRGESDEMALAAARAGLFNRLLSERVDNDQWLAPLPGDPCLRPDGNGWLSEVSAQMIADGQADPSIPLYGPTPGIAPELQNAWRAAFDRHPDLVAALDQSSWQPHRRRVRLRPENASIEIIETNIRIMADLPTGAFMTTLLDGLVTTHDAHTDQ